MNGNNIFTDSRPDPEPLQRVFLLDEKSVTWDVEDHGGIEGRRELLLATGFWEVV